ncbi:DUF262 domain-containing protein [Proteiniclasticum ruminis]|uniref:GmrSD restriction endonucleases N-terminal domain-containing protein n=1 Tax=Proteiniclasticum ruminis TaxID=398199 RepID=A0A1I5D993_9CLOT|nr:DUF262 domain-containing protein [Proteiniclasticum ruminis]SFN95760.1 Protein of unknown function DUF262 [Proteiniclasticum ruminis]
MSTRLMFKSVNDLLDEKFYVPYYQRGYRWTKQQVIDLLNDIWGFTQKEGNDKFYCLQPVVVKKVLNTIINEEYWEVVDGQQRLTTLYILLYYLTKEVLKVDSLKEEYGKEIFTISYETRPGSAKFLKNLEKDNSNIDYYYMHTTYETIKEWFTDSNNIENRTDRFNFLSTLLGRKGKEKSVQVIWYEVPVEVNSNELFTRLNLGKIPLTNSELVKALFLSETSFEKDDKQEQKKTEIAILWDSMEQRLNDEKYWAFITNENPEDYSNKIELLLDLIAKKSDKNKDPLSTFLHFYKVVNGKSKDLWSLWLDIEKYDQTLVEWYKNRDLYHKIGYLITIGVSLADLVERSLGEPKSAFTYYIDSEIAKSIRFNLESLSYENKGDYSKIYRVLTLFNIESLRTNESALDYYPFSLHKKSNWSIEHIHAQNAEGLDKTKKEQWKQWTDSHLKLIVDFQNQIEDIQLKEQLRKLESEILEVNYEVLNWDKFMLLANRIGIFFSEKETIYSDEMHGLSNLALLGQAENSALNNGVFELKRRTIISMDKDGKYIPICTKRVFLKYYNKNATQGNYYFWSYEDRKNYLEEIKAVLRRSGYLIKIEGEV